MDVPANFAVPWVTYEAGFDLTVEAAVSTELATRYVLPYTVYLVSRCLKFISCKNQEHTNISAIGLQKMNLCGRNIIVFKDFMRLSFNVAFPDAFSIMPLSQKSASFPEDYRFPDEIEAHIPINCCN
jgi:hypothetical protein